MSRLYTRAPFCQGLRRLDPVAPPDSGLKTQPIAGTHPSPDREAGTPGAPPLWPCSPPRRATDLSIGRDGKKSPLAAKQTEQWPEEKL
ncbi:hypothetical protein [Kamptonema formosum]|uniref:hypothetical protein n=1 Tax=Kamptonema formosum TaxID=331992 RepID=UPI0003459FBA|nr:hypothetical protein [Oscillatoria sp. PCC 10802]